MLHTIDRMQFVQQNNIEQYDYFVNNYEAIMTIYNICTLFKDFEIKNLSINNNTIYFELDKRKSGMPIINSSSIYDKRYSIDFKHINETNNIGITLQEVSG